MAESRFYDEGAIRRAAINLFQGWGYNFYRKENLLRADDQLVRAKAGWLLGLARTSLERAETDYRRTALPTPTRERPFPDPAAVAGAQALERLGRAVSALIGRINVQPVPENDRMTQRYRQEAATLEALGRQDELLVGLSDDLRARLDGCDGPGVLQHLSEFEAALGAIEGVLLKRGALLLGQA
jgi:hypothetical protein